MVLEKEIQAELSNRIQLEASNYTVRKRGEVARGLKGQLYNQFSVTLLAGLTDIYLVFGELVKACSNVFSHTTSAIQEVFGYFA